MTRVPNYSTIRTEPKHKPADGFSLKAFYDGLVSAPGITATVILFVGILREDLDTLIRRIEAGERDRVFQVLLLLLSILAGLRLFHSLFLARRDYSHLGNSFRDILSFLAVGFFMWSSSQIFKNGELTMLVFYTLCAMIGMLNFIKMYFLMQKGVDQIDYPVERRIQLVNVLVFAYLTIVLAFATYELYRHGRPTYASYIAVASTYIALLFNMMHSGQLTYLPKFLLKNDDDSPKRRVAAFRKMFWRSAAGLSDDEVIQVIAKDTLPDFKRLQLVRATKDDVPEIATRILNEFGYVFDYIFGLNDRDRLHMALVRLLSVAGGLGSFGFMTFYAVMHAASNREKRCIGFAKLDSIDRCGFYRLIAPFALVASFARIFGISRVLGIVGRAREIARCQPKPVKGEIRLTYLIIYAEHRRQGFANAFITLLTNALIQIGTHDIVADRLTLVVREHNAAARNLFKKAGFVAAPLEASPDPFATDEAVGKAVFMEYAANVSDPDD